MASSMDQSTWHDRERPTHRPMDTREVAARHAEEMAWNAADENLEKIHNGTAELDAYETGMEYEVYNTLRTLAENASESLRAVKHQINIGQ